MRSMFGISMLADAGRLRPFRAYVIGSLIHHRAASIIGLHPMVTYVAPSGLEAVIGASNSPEGARYAIEG